MGLSGTASVHSGQASHDWSLKNLAFPGCRSCWEVCLCVLILGGLYVVLSKRRSPEPVETDDPPVTLSETELFSLEERIIQLLKTSGGEQYQSEIVKNLGLPKSTVSATLNDLHQRGIIQKVKKGRENLIRLV